MALKVGIVTMMDSFMWNIEETCKQQGWEVKKWVYTDDKVTNSWQLGELVNWADVIFTEFCQYPLHILTHKRLRKPLITRLWRCEVYNQSYFNRIQWNNIDYLFIAGGGIAQKYAKLTKGKQQPANVKVFNGPTVHPRYVFNERKFRDPYNIAIVGNIIPRKRAYDAVQLLVDLPDKFHLSIAGRQQDPEYFQHIKDFILNNNLANRVKIYGHIEPEVLVDFYHDHDIILGMSTEESAHYVMAEGMATGCYPVMTHWSGIEEIYPEGYISRGFTKIIETIKEWGNLTDEQKLTYSSDAHRFAAVQYAPQVESELFINAVNAVVK